MEEFEVVSIHVGPDGRGSVSWCRARLVPAVEAEDAVLDEWAELHDALLGCPPSG